MSEPFLPFLKGRVKPGPTPTSSRDFCTKEGAEALKLMIEDYWLARELWVNVHLHEGGFIQALRSARVDVRSDMTNGYPTKRLREAPLLDRMENAA